MKSIIFDLDDTLYKNIKLRSERQKAIDSLTAGRREEFLALKNKGHTTTESLVLMDIGREKFLAALESVPIHMERDEKLYWMLERMKSDYRLIVVSNSPLSCVKETLRQLGVLHFFISVYGAESFLQSKPHPECFSMVREGDICVGDDFDKDLAVPKSKGAITILVGSAAGEPDHRIQSIYELENLLR